MFVAARLVCHFSISFQTYSIFNRFDSTGRDDRPDLCGHRLLLLIYIYLSILLFKIHYFIAAVGPNQIGTFRAVLYLSKHTFDHFEIEINASCKNTSWRGCVFESNGYEGE